MERWERQRQKWGQCLVMLSVSWRFLWTLTCVSASQVTDLLDGVIKVHAPLHAKVSMAIQLNSEMKARDITARFEVENSWVNRETLKLICVESVCVLMNDSSLQTRITQRRSTTQTVSLWGRRKYRWVQHLLLLYTRDDDPKHPIMISALLCLYCRRALSGSRHLFTGCLSC